MQKEISAKTMDYVQPSVFDQKVPVKGCHVLSPLRSCDPVDVHCEVGDDTERWHFSGVPILHYW